MIKEYLDKYGRDEKKLLQWLKTNGANPAIAVNVISKFAKDNKEFVTGYDLDHELLKECHNNEMNPLIEFVDAKEKLEETIQAADDVIKVSSEILAKNLNIQTDWQSWVDVSRKEYQEWFEQHKQLFEKKPSIFERVKKWIQGV